jgi:hypothetical protein
MANLSRQEAKESLRNQGTKKTQIQRAIQHQERIEFHVDPVDRLDDQKYSFDFKKWVEKIVDKTKYDVFCHMLQTPVETVDFTEGLFSELKKVFSAKDRFTHHQFKNSELDKDFDQYLVSIGNHEFWKTKGYEAMKTSINSVLIVDLDSTQEGEAPEPYYYLLPIGNVINWEFNDSGEFEYISFQRKDKFFVFDTTQYRSFTRAKGGEYILETENEHDLEYTPVRLFWSDRFNKKYPIQRQSLISNALGKLDWLLSMQTMSKHETLYAGFPIQTIYDQKCSYVDKKGQPCESGKIDVSYENSEGTHIQEYEDCPKCKGGTINNLLGPGTTLVAPGIANKEDPDMIDGVNRLGAEVESLEWINKFIENQEKIIRWNTIGFTQEQSKEAMNEMQVAGNFESRENVLLSVAGNYEAIEQFAIETIGKLRYGSEIYMGSVVSYGKEFHFQSLGFISKQLQESRANGLPIYEVINVNNQYIKSKYRDDPKMIQRVVILNHIEPYQGYTVEEIKGFETAIDPTKLLIKLNIQEYIQRFEIEFANIVSFMQFSDFDSKIKFIETKIESYAKEEITARTERIRNEGASGNAAGSSGTNDGGQQSQGS